MRVVFLFLFLLSFNRVSCQNKALFSVALLPKTGLLFAHRPTMSHLIDKRNSGVEVEFTKQDVSETDWSKAYHYPSRGVSILYHDFGNRNVLGIGVSIFRFTKFPLFQHKKWGNLDFRLGNGVSYITKKYNSFNNKKNIAIGSHINGFVNFNLTYTKRFGRYFTGLGFDFSHFSNASLKMPNQGLNTLTTFITLGMDLEPRKFYPFEMEDSIAFNPERPHKKWIFHFITGLKQNIPGVAESRTFGVGALQAFYRKQLGYKWDVEFGGDLIYNEANRWLNNEVPGAVLANIQIGGYTGLACNIYQTQIYFGIGGYALNLGVPVGWVYNRIGARWLVNNQWDLMLGVKAHFGIADYLEWGIGYRL